ncbi:hypothetical protein TSAR_009246 [Trichomalopsis sarcophagae]|uniref:SWIM-type domain-containing protein n=1 Tax=Trichomalopsis sarcophagae TaxID=543379 RepID=A0A232EE46_9HYME|nr:hypothetical protein TSAR_009246 [Trichomalopsis sarcophagae]
MEDKDNVEDDSINEFSPRSKQNYEAKIQSAVSARPDVQANSKVCANPLAKRNLAKIELRKLINIKKFTSDNEVKEFMDHHKLSVVGSHDKSKLVNVLRVNANSSVSKRYILYNCVYGPSKANLQPLSMKKKKTFTQALGCPARIALSLSNDGSHYIVSDAEEHDDSHQIVDVSNVFVNLVLIRIMKLVMFFKNFQSIPKKVHVKDRKLTAEQVKQVQERKRTGGNKMKMIVDLHNQGSKCTLRDISNIQAAMRSESLGNSVSATVDILNKYVYEFKTNAANDFEALAFFTPGMRAIFQAWPEFNMIDATYSLLQLDYPLVLWNVVDGNGHTEIVAVCIVAHETDDSYKWFIYFVIKHNEEACSKISCFMGDKDGTIRSCIKSKFNVPMLICEMDITKEVRVALLEIIRKMIYSYSECRYNELYSEFCEIASKEVRTYFDHNWHNCKNEWVRGFMNFYNFCNETNNRTESLNQKIKLFCDKNQCLADFVSHFLEFIVHIHQYERDVEIIRNFDRRPAYLLSDDLTAYFNYLSNYAFRFIEDQIDRMKFVENIHFVNKQVALLKSNSGNTKYTVSPILCTCKVFLSMGLPCRHIFKVRLHLSMTLFDENLVNRRWSKEHLKQHRVFFTEKEVASSNVDNQNVVTCIASNDLNVLGHSDCSDKNKDVEYTCVNAATTKDEKCEHSFTCKGAIPKIHTNVLRSSFCNENVGNVACSKDKTKTVYSTKCNVLSKNDFETNVNDVLPEGNLESPKNDDEVLQCCLPNENVENVVHINDKSTVVSKHSMKRSVIKRTNEVKSNISDSLPIGNSDIPNSEVDLSSIKLLKVSSKRGRPKGKMLTPIGLPKKTYKEPVAYKKRTKEDRAKFILSLIVPKVTMQNFDINNSKIGINNLKLKKLPCIIHHDDIVLNEVESYMDADAFATLLEAVTNDAKNVVWICYICKKNLEESQRADNQPSVAHTCDSCLKWYHAECLNIENIVDDEDGPFYFHNCLK